MPPLTTATAAELGISRRQLRSASYRKLLHGVYLPADEPLTIAKWVAAARLVLPADAVPTGRTALQLAGLDLGRVLPLQFATTSGAQSRRAEIVLHRMAAGSTRPGMLDALIEYARSASLLEAVIAADWLLNKKLVRFKALVALRDHPGATVRSMAGLARVGTESVRETRLRLCLVLAGLPEPQLQVVLHDDQGFIGRYDMGYEQYRLLIDYEGDQHRTDKAQWTRDIMRVERAGGLGCLVVRVTAELMADPWSQVQRVHRELAARGYQGPAPRCTAMWEAAFGAPRVRRAA